MQNRVEWLRGISLTYANLNGIDLVNHHKRNGYDFSHADFYHANLKSGHLFNINLTNASVMKADLRFANLNRSNFKKTNMLGVKWHGSKLEHVKFGGKIQQELNAKKAIPLGKYNESIDFLDQAEEIYRDLHKHAESKGRFSSCSFFIQKELTMKLGQTGLNTPCSLYFNQ